MSRQHDTKPTEGNDRESSGGGPGWHRLEGLAGRLGVRELKAGDHLGPIEIVRSLGSAGRGAFGQVFEGFHQGLDQRVAVKVLLHEGVGLEDRFRLEAQAAARLRDSHIVTVHDLIEWQGRPIIVMEYLSGGTLEERVEPVPAKAKSRSGSSGDTRFRWAADVCRQVAAGLEHAHEHGVIHRDIKPANILFDGDDRVKVADFGLAKLDNHPGMTQPGQRPGTPLYMSPEQVAGVVRLDARSDIFSLGVVLYRLMTGVLPFQEDDRSGLFKAILTSTPARPRQLVHSVPAELEAICLRSLEKDPNERYKSAAEMEEDLRRYLAGESTIAKVRGPVGRGWQSLRTTKATTMSAVVVAISAVWWGVDRQVLLPAAMESEAQDVWRHVALGLATLPVMVCAAAALSRMIGSRVLGVITGVVLALVVAGDQSMRMTAWRVDQNLIAAEQRAAAAEAALDAEFLRARAAFIQNIDLLQRRDVRDIEAYELAWLDRFTASDLFHVGRAYLMRQRVTSALVYAEQLVDRADIGVQSLGLLEAVHRALGNSAAADEYADRLESFKNDRSVTWSDWEAQGDMLAGIGRFGSALEAYTLAAGKSDAPRSLNLVIGYVLSDLCRIDEAWRRLADPLVDRPDNVGVHVLAISLASREGDFDRARQHLDTLKELALVNPDDDWSLLTVKETEYGLLLSEGDPVSARSLLDGLLELRSDDPLTVEWCARKLTEVHGDLEAGAQAYSRLLRLDPKSVMARIGIAACLVGHAKSRYRLNEVSTEELIAAMERGIELNSEANMIDGSYHEALYNLGVLNLTERMESLGVGISDLPVEVLSEAAKFFERAAELGGRSLLASNNAAGILTQLWQKTGDDAALIRARDYIQRALELNTRDEASQCPVTEAGWFVRAMVLDTLADVLVDSGDCEAGRQASSQAMELVPAGHGRLETLMTNHQAREARCR